MQVIPNKCKKKINYPINIKAIFYVESKRRIDLTNLLEALDDMLVKADIIQDDCRDIIAGHDGSRVYWDKENPRIEIEITKFTDLDYEVWKKVEVSHEKGKTKNSRKNS